MPKMANKDVDKYNLDIDSLIYKIISEEDNDLIRIEVYNALEALTDKNVSSLAKDLGDKITRVLYQSVAEEIIEYGIKNPKYNLMYFTRKLQHDSIFDNIKDILKKKLSDEIIRSEKQDFGTTELENIGIIIGQFLTSDIKGYKLSDYIEKPVECLIKGYLTNLGIVIIPLLVNILIIYSSKSSKSKWEEAEYRSDIVPLLYIFDEICKRNLTHRYFMVKINKLLRSAKRNGGFDRKSYPLENPDPNVIKKYKPCENIIFGKCVYGEACKYNHSFIAKFVQSPEGKVLLANDNLIVVHQSI